MKFRTIYDEKRPSPTVSCDDESLCLTYQAQETSIERLVKLATQNPDYLSQFMHSDCDPEYGECPSPMDYQDALGIVAAAEEAYYALPPEVRVKFSHPTDFLLWLENSDNYEEALELGLLDPEKVRERKEALESSEDSNQAG